MTNDERFACVVRAIEATVAHDTSAVEELFTPDVEASLPTVTVSSRVELAVELEDHEDELSEVAVEAKTLIATDDRVCTEWVASAIQSAPFVFEEGSSPRPTERRVTFRGVTVADFDGERICSVRHYWNEAERVAGPGAPPEG